MMNMTKNQLFEALQKSTQKYNELKNQLRSLDMKNPVNRILVLELPPLIRSEKLQIESLKYYYENYEKIQRIAKLEEKKLSL